MSFTYNNFQNIRGWLTIQKEIIKKSRTKWKGEGNYGEMYVVEKLLSQNKNITVEIKKQVKGNEIDLYVTGSDKPKCVEVKMSNTCPKIQYWQFLKNDWFVFLVRNGDDINYEWVLSKEELREIKERGKVPTDGENSEKAILFASSLSGKKFGSLESYRREWKGFTTKIEEDIIKHPQKYEGRFDRIV